MRRIWLAIVAALLACVLSACGSTPATSHDPEHIAIMITGSQVSPNGDRVKVGVDQQVVLDITADRAGTLHVHSNPGRELEYAAGTTTIKLAIDQPGIVDVESHSLDKIIVSLEVS